MNCISIKSKREAHLPCPKPKRQGDFCGVHARSNNPRIYVPAPPPSKVLTYQELLDTKPQLSSIDLTLKENQIDSDCITSTEEKIQRLLSYLQPLYQQALEESTITLDRSICQNPTDFFLLEPLSAVPDSYFFSFKENDRIYGCDIRSFHKYFTITSQSDNAELLNPYTQQPLTKNIIQDYNKKLDFLKKEHPK